jgi:peptidoglycan/LPS O-acetylase OafA/YrhL
MIKINSNTSRRIYEFDIFRVLACITIILTHIWYIYPIGIELKSIFVFLGTCGLTIFFFFSGFFISKYPVDNFENNIRKFWENRIKRLIPAMYVAIFFYIIVEAFNLGSAEWDIPLNLWSILSNLLCLQAFFYQLRFFALWYIGALILMYLIHTCIRRIVCDNIIQYIFLSFLFFAFVVMLSYVKLPIYGFEFEPRVIEYYFVFFIGTVSGMIIGHENPKEHFYPLIIFFCLLVIKVIFYFSGIRGIIYPFNLPLFLTLLGLILFILIIKLHFFILQCSLSRKLL